VSKKKAKRASPAIKLDSFIPYQLSLLVHRSTLANSELYVDSHRLTVQEWKVLSIIADRGPLVPADIRRMGTQDKSTISWAIGRLERAQLLVRQPRANDGRTFEVALSKKGWAYYSKVAPKARRKALSLLRALSKSERTELGRLIAKLADT
jgi:DNA-binding MarR family transcriptional regulator